MDKPVEMKIGPAEVQLETKVRWWFWYCFMMPLAAVQYLTNSRTLDRLYEWLAPYLVKTYVDGKRVKGNG